MSNCNDEIKTGLKDLKLYKEDGEYFLDATYITENKYGFYEERIPKIKFPDNEFEYIINRNIDPFYNLYSPIVMTINFGNCEILPKSLNETDDEPSLCYTKLIKKKVYKKTLEEIEKELGYEIELVSKKENDSNG